MREAIYAANESSGADTIIFNVSGVLQLAMTLPYITDPAGLTIDGTGQEVKIIGEISKQVLFVDSGAALLLKKVTISSGFIYSKGTLNVEESIFDDSKNDLALLLPNERRVANISASLEKEDTEPCGIFSEDSFSVSGTQEGCSFVSLGNITISSASFINSLADAQGTMSISESDFSGSNIQSKLAMSVQNSRFSDTFVMSEEQSLSITSGEFSGFSRVYGRGPLSFDGTFDSESGGWIRSSDTINFSGTFDSGNDSFISGDGIVTIEGTLTTSDSYIESGDDLYFDGSNIVGYGVIRIFAENSIEITNSTFQGELIDIATPGQITLLNTLIACDDTFTITAANMTVENVNLASNNYALVTTSETLDLSDSNTRAQNALDIVAATDLSIEESTLDLGGSGTLYGVRNSVVSHSVVTGATYDDGSFYSYAYDAVGNRLSQTTAAGSDSYAYDAANRLTAVNEVPYSWDANGNLLSDGTRTYGYDSANRLSAVSGADYAYQYVYNGLGDRMQSLLDGTGTTYTLDLNNGLTQVLADGANTYLYGLNRISQTSVETSGYFLGDALNSVRQVVDPEAEIKLVRSYSPYGEASVSLGDYETDYSYTGELTNSSGLINLRARWYDTSTGRFISKDTWAGDYQSPITLTKWLYSHANPILLTDPSGNDPWWCGNDMDCYVKWIADYQMCQTQPPITSKPKIPIEQLSVSTSGYEFIKKVETLPGKGWERWPYNDTGKPGGTCTIGYGTVLSDPDFDHCSQYLLNQIVCTDPNDGQICYKVKDRYMFGQELTQKGGLSEERAKKYLENEIRKNTEVQLKIDIPGVMLYQYEYDALVSYFFNTGYLQDLIPLITSYSSGEGKNRDVTNRMMKHICDHSGTILDSLKIRRQQEGELFLYGDYVLNRTLISNGEEWITKCEP